MNKAVKQLLIEERRGYQLAALFLLAATVAAMIVIVGA